MKVYAVVSYDLLEYAPTMFVYSLHTTKEGAECELPEDDEFDEYGIKEFDLIDDDKCLESVVRCKDCKHSDSSGTECDIWGRWVEWFSEYGEEANFETATVKPEGFCSYGKRRALQ